MTTAAPAWTFVVPAAAGRRRTLGDLYVVALGVLLFGYAFLGRTFAYLGAPPIFIGEVMLALGLGLVLFTCRVSTLVPAPAMWAVLVLQGWVFVRTIPYLSEYGIDAPRDAMVVGYGAYAFVVAGLLLQRPSRLLELLRSYRTLAIVIGAFAWLMYLIYRSFQNSVPTLPWAPDVHVIENKPGDLAVHMAAITAFLVLGWRRVSPWLLVLVVIGAATMMVGNRGGMVGFLLSMGAFWVLKPGSAKFGRLLFVGFALIAVGSLVDTSSLQTNEGNRSLSVEQLWENVKSVFGKSDQAMLSTTTEWRTQWWDKIVDYTVFGEYFWTGRGFGINVATADGFNIDTHGTLRSPHSVHMTMLARAGVPGVLLWMLVHLLWWYALLSAWYYARERGLSAWMGFFALCAVFWIAAIVNASFDVYLEGPMGGIWFWTVFGAAMAGTRLVRTDPYLLDDIRVVPDDEAAPPSAQAWAWREVKSVPPVETPSYGWASGPQPVSPADLTF